MSKPVLLIDVDGVLCPYFPGDPEPGYERLLAGELAVWINPAHGEWLRHIVDTFDLVWTTACEH